MSTASTRRGAPIVRTDLEQAYAAELAAFAAASTSDPATWRAQWRQMLEVDSTSDKLIVSMGGIGHTRRARPPPLAGASLSVEAGRFCQLRASVFVS